MNKSIDLEEYLENVEVMLTQKQMERLTPQLADKILMLRARKRLEMLEENQ